MYPTLDEQTVNKFRGIKASFPSNKPGQVKYVNVT
jgi:hypothetical protein